MNELEEEEEKNFSPAVLEYFIARNDTRRSHVV